MSCRFIDFFGCLDVDAVCFWIGVKRGPNLCNWVSCSVEPFVAEGQVLGL